MLKVNIDQFSYATEPVLENIILELKTGQHLFILGESGCGKSTLLKAIYGLLDLDHGSIFWKQKQILGPAYNLVPGESYIKYLAQDFDLMPFISVADNIGKHLSRIDMKARQERIDELLEVVNMTAHRERHVKLLSGGQKQRVALARALAKEPELMLLDEPFSHIDHFLRNDLRRKVYAYLKKENITCITASHDSEEALSFADEICIMRAGKFIRSGTAEALFNNPETRYAASFFGDVNVLPKFIFDEKNKTTERLFLYPQQLKATHKKTALSVTVINAYFKGSHWLIEGIWKGESVFFNHPVALDKQSEVYLERQLG